MTSASEAYVQSVVRRDAHLKSEKLWRNNVGALVPQGSDRPVRFGLANDSAQLNAELKSGDLIGWRRILITPDWVGHVVAQFVSRECKPEAWKFTGTDRELAQLRWADLVNREGGHAVFVTGPEY